MATHPANWHQDPTGRHELRYWDGATWTDHVSDRGVIGTDPLDGPHAPSGSRMDRLDTDLTLGDEGSPATIAEQMSGSGHRGIGRERPVPGGGGGLFTEPVLIVNQKAKLIELNNQYGVYDQHGTQIAAVGQIGQSTAKKLVRLVSNLDQYLTHRLEVIDAAGTVLLRLTRPAKIVRSSVTVEDGGGREIGRIVQQNVFGKINFGLESAGASVGAIKAENWRAWNFRIEDTTGTEVARVTKTFEGVAKTLFTTADNYVVEIVRRPPEPLNSLVIASALSIDTALKQDSRGLS